jgi:pimeloyl-ACP methyl ester carboxylesterase
MDGPTFVLVPGAGGRAWSWHRLVPALAALGHDAIAVELPAGDARAGLAEYADTVVLAAGDRPEVALVAHSMGGLSAPLACDRLPVRMLVLLNAMVPLPGETGGDWWAATGQAKARMDAALRAGRDPNAELDPMAEFFHDAPPDVVASALAMGEPAQSDTPFGDPWPLDRWPDVPTRFLQGRDDRFFPLEFARRMVDERLGHLGVTVEEMPGGHMVALTQPKELAARLHSYVS